MKKKSNMKNRCDKGKISYETLYISLYDLHDGFNTFTNRA